MTPSTPPDPDKNRNDPSKDTDDGTGNKDPETPESLPVKTSSDVSAKQMDSSPNPPSSDDSYVSDYSDGEIAKMIEDSLPNRKIEREYEERMLREKAGDRTLSSPTTTQEDVPIPNNETLLPGFTSHMQMPMFQLVLMMKSLLKSHLLKIPMLMGNHERKRILHLHPRSSIIAIFVRLLLSVCLVKKL